MRRHVSKVFLDSRHTLPDGTFVIPGEAVLLEPSSRCWLGEFTCVASWDTIDSTNNDFVVIELGVSRNVSIPMGPHDIESLRAAMETALNTNKGAGMGDYTVTRTSTGVSGSTSRAFRVNCSAGLFAIPPASNNMKDICNFPFGDLASGYQISHFVDVRRVHSVYLHTDFGNHNCVTPSGVRGILAKVPVTTGYGGLVHWATGGSEHDFIEAGAHSLSTLRIELRDASGRLLDLNGTSWSCTLLFER